MYKDQKSNSSNCNIPLPELFTIEMLLVLMHSVLCNAPDACMMNQI
jgi:hypothetical protein